MWSSKKLLFAMPTDCCPFSMNTVLDSSFVFLFAFLFLFSCIRFCYMLVLGTFMPLFEFHCEALTASN